MVLLVTADNLFVLFVFALINTVTVYSQQQTADADDEVKYVIFTSNKEDKEIGEEGIYNNTSKVKSDISKSFPITFRYISKIRGINGVAAYYRNDLEELSNIRKLDEIDKLVINENSIEFLDSVNLIDMDVLFPKMTKDEFIKIWNSMWNKKVYFIDRSEIKNHKVKLYPVYVFGINLY